MASLASVTPSASRPWSVSSGPETWAQADAQVCADTAAAIIAAVDAHSTSSQAKGPCVVLLARVTADATAMAAGATAIAMVAGAARAVVAATAMGMGLVVLSQYVVAGYLPGLAATDAAAAADEERLLDLPAACFGGEDGLGRKGIALLHHLEHAGSGAVGPGDEDTVTAHRRRRGDHLGFDGGFHLGHVGELVDDGFARPIQQRADFDVRVASFGPQGPNAA